MDEVFINVKNTSIEDLFRKDLVSVEELFVTIENFKDEVKELKEKLESKEEQIKEFYTPKSPYEIYGVSERDFL